QFTGWTTSLVAGRQDDLWPQYYQRFRSPSYTAHTPTCRTSMRLRPPRRRRRETESSPPRLARPTRRPLRLAPAPRLSWGAVAVASFAARFTITNAITAGLTAIERAGGFLEAATLSDEWVA